MKKYAKTLITLGICLIAVGLILWNWKNPTPPSPKPSVGIDTTIYTDVVIINKSNIDSVKVYVTLASTKSIIGKFGMDSSNIYPNKDSKRWCKIINGYDTTYCPCKGTFWAKKGVEYHFGDTTAAISVVVSWGVDNQACSAAQSGGDASDNGVKYPFGINIFEFTINTWWQGGKVTGNGESFDISCVDGLHSLLKEKVTSFGPRNNVGLKPNFGAFWDYGYKVEGQFQKFDSAQNGITFKECINIPAVYPYGCDWGYEQHYFPYPCNSPTYAVECSTAYGDINTSQTNRPGQGGRVTCEFLGFTKGVPAEK